MKKAHPRDESGPPDDDSGPPDDDSGPPDDDSGPLDDDSGPPDDDSGPPDYDSGPPDVDSGPPDDNSGPPEGDGLPSANNGFSRAEQKAMNRYRVPSAFTDEELEVVSGTTQYSFSRYCQDRRNSCINETELSPESQILLFLNRYRKGKSFRDIAADWAIDTRSAKA